MPVIKQVFCAVITVAALFRVTSTKTNQHHNNACTSYMDYFFIETSANCYYNPGVLAQTTEIIQRHIGFSETYNVTTDDGYILTIFRIPRRDPKGVILLLHPVTTDSIVWVGQNNESLAFLLWHLDYDIWLPNHRGTHFSRKHVNLNITDEEYWDFTFHEIGIYDYKTVIEFVKSKTNNNEITIISHSMSTTSSLIYASLLPEEAASSVKIFITMSPVCYLKHVRSPVKYFSYITPMIKIMNKLLHVTHLQEYDSEAMKRWRSFMLSFPIKYFFVAYLSFMEGWNPREVDPALINLMISHHPRSYPWKLFYHYVQQYNAGGRFQMYDYGQFNNQKLYGSVTPPEYPVENIIAPFYLIYSDEDSLATPEDVELLYDKLSPKAKIYGKLKVSGMNHIDYHYGKNRIAKIYSKVIQLLDRIYYSSS